MGFLGSIGDAIGGAVDYVGDKVGSAAEAVGGVVAGPVGDLVTDFIPGPIDDLAQQGISSLVNGGGGGGPSMGIARGGMGNGGLYSQRGGGGFLQPDPVDFGPFTMNPGAAFGGGNGGQGQGQPAFTEPLPSFGGGGGMNGQMMGGGGFQSALMASLVKKSIRSDAGRAVLEAVTSGSLQGGIIQSTIPVQTPRGEENHSPPGFRTVYVNDEPFAVFKPVAKSLGLLPKTSRAKITAADMKAIRKADRLAGTLKRLAKKTGRLKVTNK